MWLKAGQVFALELIIMAHTAMAQGKIIGFNPISDSNFLLMRIWDLVSQSQPVGHCRHWSDPVDGRKKRRIDRRANLLFKDFKIW